VKLSDLIPEIAKILEELSIDYMFVGSIAVNTYGIIRTTQDLDIVVDLDSNKLNSLLEVFKCKGYMLEPEIMKKTFKISNIIQLYEPEGIFKIELWLAKSEKTKSELGVCRKSLYFDKKSAFYITKRM